MAESLSHLLNYNDKPSRAMSSRQYTSKITAVNGNSHTLGNEIIFKLPANELGKFCDFQHSGVEFTFTNNSANAEAHNDVKLPVRSGILYTIKKITIQCAGATLSECDNYNQIADMMMTLQTSDEYAGNVGHYLTGTAGVGSGGVNTQVAIARNGASRKFFIPLAYTGLYNSNTYLPLCSRTSIEIRILFDDADKCLSREGANGAVLANSEFTITDPVFRMKTIELSAPAFDAVVSSADGRFDLTTIDYRYTSDNVPAKAGASTYQQVSNLGFSFSSLNNVIFTFRNTSRGDVQALLPQRSTNGLIEYCVLINGEKIPARVVQLSPTNGGEAVAELLSANGVLNSVLENRLGFGGGYLLESSTGATSSALGTFIACVDLTSMRSEQGSIISGISTIGSNVQLELNFNNLGATDPKTLDVFATYVSMYSLDLKGSQNWVSSI